MVNTPYFFDRYRGSTWIVTPPMNLGFGLTGAVTLSDGTPAFWH